MVQPSQVQLLPQPAGRAATPRPRTVFCIAFSPMTMDEMVEVLVEEAVPAGSGPRLLITTNLDHVVNLRRNPAFRAAYRSAWSVTVDGAPILVYARLRGVQIPGRITGADLLPALLARLSAAKHRVFFLANNQASAEALVRHMTSAGFPCDQIRYLVPEFGFERDTAASAAIVAAIASHRPTHLFLGLGAPKSEVWVDAQREALGDCYAMPIGAALDFMTGTRRRAPRWCQRLGMEWVWRLAQEPRRLYRRYLIESWQFAAAVRDDLRG